MFVANQGRMFINARFRPTPVQDYTTWVRVCSILSILSLAFLVLTSGYFFHQLMNPCLTYKLLTPVPAATKHACHDVHSASFPGKVDCILSVITHPWREDTTGRNDGSPAICLTSADPSLGERLACMLPDIAYHPPATIKDECNGSTADTYFYWPLCVFVCAAVGAMVGLIFEVYLVCMGTPFNFDLTPMTASIVNIRHLIYGLVYCCIMLTTIALTVDPQKVPTEIPQLYLLFSHSASFLVGVLTITLYFQVDSSVVVVLGVGMISQLAWIFYQGTVFGGVVATRFLWCGVFIHLLGAILFEPNTPGASTMYHIFACVTGWCIYVALTLSGNDSPEYASNVAGALFPNGLYSLSLAISLVVGAIFALWASPKTYQAYRSMVSCMIWSVIYFLILANPMLLFKPYRLSEVYAKLGTRRLCVRPYSEQHVKYMPKMIGIPSISG
jgi:hypothetical protein